MTGRLEPLRRQRGGRSPTGVGGRSPTPGSAQQGAAGSAFQVVENADFWGLFPLT